jgi:hypothetical protein
LRKQVNSDEDSPWLKVPVNLRTSIKSRLLERLLVEQEYVISSIYDIRLTLLCRSIVRHSLARVISAIASVELPHEQWPELLPFVQNLCESRNAIHRESGAFILFTILEVVVEGLQDKVADFLNLFRHLLVDPESIEVRLVTVRALGTLAGYIDIEDKAEIVRDFACLSMITHRAIESVPRTYSSDYHCYR